MSPELAATPLPINSFKEYVGLLRQLHALCVQGKGESPEADEIRDQMDRPWEDLSPAERDLVRGLSADLLWIIDGPVVPPVGRDESFQQYGPLYLEARKRGDWPAALEALRHLAPYLPAPELAFLRGQAWRKLDDLETALLFLEHAHRLSPADDTYAYLALECLWRIDPDRAAAEARRVLDAEPARPVGEVVLAATILLSRVDELPQDERSPCLQNLAGVFWRAVVRMTMRGQLDKHAPLFAMACDHGALCLARLGAEEKAIDLINRGLEVRPNHTGLLVNRGILWYESHEDEALADFRQAIAQGSRSVWPYFFVARSSFVKRDFAGCLENCVRALPLAKAPEARVNLLHWMAICQAELGFPPETVDASFHAASELAPDHPALQHNWQAFRAKLGQQTPGDGWQSLDVPRGIIRLEPSILPPVG